MKKNLIMLLFLLCIAGTSFAQASEQTSYDSTIDATPNRILSPILSSETESVCYYTIGGVRVLQPSRGIYIKVVRYKDGHTEQSKVCVR